MNTVSVPNSGEESVEVRTHDTPIADAMSEFMKEPEMQPSEESSEIMYLCKNRKCQTEVNQQGDLCVQCAPPEIETCAKCGTSDDVWAFGHCTKCWVDRNTQISDG